MSWSESNHFGLQSFWNPIILESNHFGLQSYWNPIILESNHFGIILSSNLLESFWVPIILELFWFPIILELLEILILSLSNHFAINFLSFYSRGQGSQFFESCFSVKLDFLFFNNVPCTLCGIYGNLLSLFFEENLVKVLISRNIRWERISGFSALCSTVWKNLLSPKKYLVRSLI